MALTGTGEMSLSSSLPREGLALKNEHLDSRDPFWYPVNQPQESAVKPEQNNDCLFIVMECFTPNASEFPSEFLILCCSKVGGEMQALMQLCDLKFYI